MEPAPLAVNKAIEELHHCLAEVNAEIGILLHQRVLDINTQNKNLTAQLEKISTQNKGLAAQVEGLRAQSTKREEDEAREKLKEDVESLAHFRQILGETPGKYKDPVLLVKTLESIFPEAMGAMGAMGAFGIHQGWSNSYCQMTSQFLRLNTAYQSWMGCSSSSLLVFAGSTAEEGRASQSSLCWLSPAALHVFNLSSSEGKNVAFHSCHPDYRDTECSSQLIVSSLISQLLDGKPERLRHKVKDFEIAAKSDAWKSKDRRVAMECQFNMLRAVLDLFSPNEEMFFVLDRLDLCDTSKRQFLEALQGLTRRTENKLKILVIMGRIRNEYDRDACCDFLSSGAEYHSFGDMNWNQARKSY